MAIENFADKRGYFCNSILFIFIMFYLGCATAPPKPVTIKHERTPSLRDASIPKPHYHKKPVEQDVALFKEKDLSKEPVDQTIAVLVNLLKERNVISADEADRILEKSKTQAAQDKQIFREQVKSEVREQLPEEIEKSGLAAALPEWTKRIRFSGDIRIRYEGDFFDKDNFNEFTTITEGIDTQELRNTWSDEYHFNYRIRFGAEVHVNERLDAVIQLATGKDRSPVSPNTSLEDYLNRNGVFFELAYLKWQPFDYLTIWGGRIPNLWFSPSELLWDADLNFDGLVLNLRKPFTDSLISFLTVGVFPLQESNPIRIFDFSQHRKWLYAGQAGIERKDQKGISAKVGAAYYVFNNITGKLNTDPLDPGATDWSSPPFLQTGNTLFYIDPTNSFRVGLASEFKELNLTGTLDIGFWDPYHVVFLGDYVKNLGFDRSEVAKLTGNPDQPEETTGYQIGMSIGHPKIEKFGQWKTYLYYKHVEADSVVDAFTDSDFHLGGTNTKGWILGADVGLWKNVWLVLKWLTANEISGPPLAIDVFFVDFNARF